MQLHEYENNSLLISFEDNFPDGDLLSEAGQRQLLLWFKEHRGAMWREIFCDGCPEVC